MDIRDLINKKRGKHELSDDELTYIINGFMSGEIKDYQMSSFLMAVCYEGLSKRETAKLTMLMAGSGDMVDLSDIEGIKVDKHSTGGVGDKTTFIISPIVASLGVPVAKMSGRGLGHTGGTIDKLESIPGIRTDFSDQEFKKIVRNTGICVTGQSQNLAPADGLIYKLRDATATVSSIPLIASSVMSKKIAGGADAILLDVKTGSGAFMKTIDDAILLARQMVEIGTMVGRETVALITDMDTPLGYAIGNSLELKEVIETLNGRGPKDLVDDCVELAKNMLYLAGKGSLEACEEMVLNAIQSGAALKKLADMVEAQGGDRRYIEDPSLFKKPSVFCGLISEGTGYIVKMDAELCGNVSCLLGAGRRLKDEPIDYSAGIVLKKKTGDFVKAGEELAVLYTSSEEKLEEAVKKMEAVYQFSETKPDSHPLIYARIDKNGVERYAHTGGC